MNKLAIAFSFITLVLLGADFFYSNEQDIKNGRSKASTEFYNPVVISKTPLAIEKHWLDLQKQAELARTEKLAAKNNNGEPKIDKTKLLTVGDNSYQLLGIFVSENTPFILVKPLEPSNTKQAGNSSSSGIIKLLKGQELTPGIVLTQLTSNKIVLQGENETFEFKLFERSNHENQ